MYNSRVTAEKLQESTKIDVDVFFFQITTKIRKFILNVAKILNNYKKLST